MVKKKKKQNFQQTLRDVEVGELVKIWPLLPLRLSNWIIGTVITRCLGDDKYMIVTGAGEQYDLNRNRIFVDEEEPIQEMQLFPNRVSPTLLANQLVSIQPLYMSKGLVFFMDYAYGQKSDTKKEDLLED